MRKSAPIAPGNCNPVVTDISPFGTCVVWTLGDDSWKSTSSDFQATTGLSRWSLHHSSHPLYDFVLEFTNTQPYNYYFYDQEGDSYQVNTYKMTDHLVRYNSNKPNLAFAKGT